MSKTINKEIIKTIKNTKGRFISLVCLIMLGSFALVGLFVTGPNMRQTSSGYFDKLNLADLTITNDYGLDDQDVSILESLNLNSNMEYGYFKDVNIKQLNDGIRIFSQTDEISKFSLLDGHFPINEEEIALSYNLKDKASIGDSVDFEEKVNINGSYSLNRKSFKVVGYVDSSEYTSYLSMGKSASGDGELKGFGVVSEKVFSSDVYTIARIDFDELNNLDSYSNEYKNILSSKQKEVIDSFEGRSSTKLTSIKDKYVLDINDGEAKLDTKVKEYELTKSKLDEAKGKLDQAKMDIQAKENLLNAEVENGWRKINDAENQVSNALLEIEEAESSITLADKKIDDSEKEYQANLMEYNDKKNQYDTLYGVYKINHSILENLKSIASASGEKLEQEKATCDALLSKREEGIDTSACEFYLNQTYPSSKELLNEQLKLIATKEKELATSKNELDASKGQLIKAKFDLDKAHGDLEKGKSDLASGKSKLIESKKVLKTKMIEINQSKSSLELSKESASLKLNVAKQELEKSELEYQKNLQVFDSKKTEIERRLKESKDVLDSAKNMLTNMELPKYYIDSRRESIGSEGYKIYETIAEVIDSISAIFPVFLYIVAALVSIATMSRFVEEQRTLMGTYKSMGISNFQIRKKYLYYGMGASIIGTAIGVALGHYILPMAINQVYKNSFSIPTVQLYFYPTITIVAFVIGILSTFIPAFYVTRKDLKRNAAELLRPKEPAKSSKILLERIPFLWNRLKFSQKVTLRNLFRYKKRMIMTIFGVCGSVSLLIMGLGIQTSISGSTEKQFNEVFNYDLAVIKNVTASEYEAKQINDKLEDSSISSYINFHYDEMYIKAGKSMDKHEVRVMSPENYQSFNDFIRLRNLATGQFFKLNSNSVVLSQLTANLLNVDVGDNVTIFSNDGSEVSLTINAVTEMYIGHYVFISKEQYLQEFGKTYDINAQLVKLTDSTTEKSDEIAKDFMELTGVKGILQSSSAIMQINSIVHSLNVTMYILIGVASILALVILYNLNNINITERMRELSTIKVLGFYNNEVSMYIYKETLINSLVGCLVGCLLGKAMHHYIIAKVTPEDVMFSPNLTVISIIIPLVLIAVIVGFLGLIIYNKLMKVDMIASLKSNE